MVIDPPALKLKVQLLCGEEIAMGPGKADLLDAIAREGSISGAGRAMGMSYRRAWLLVDAMNRCWSAPIVATAPGRAKEGGARLTEEGLALLASYRALVSRADQALHGTELEGLTRNLRAQPRPRRSGGSSDG
jgi:molybdate transport system regulatory protein